MEWIVSPSRSSHLLLFRMLQRRRCGGPKQTRGGGYVRARCPSGSRLRHHSRAVLGYSNKGWQVGYPRQRIKLLHCLSLLENLLEVRLIDRERFTILNSTTHGSFSPRVPPLVGTYSIYFCATSRQENEISPCPTRRYPKTQPNLACNTSWRT